jgi:hypothetical protein
LVQENVGQDITGEQMDWCVTGTINEPKRLLAHKHTSRMIIPSMNASTCLKKNYLQMGQSTFA